MCVFARILKPTLFEYRDSRRLKTYLSKLEREGAGRVRMFAAVTAAYLVFWGPLFLVTLFSYGDYKKETPSASHEVSEQTCLKDETHRTSLRANKFFMS